ncbi:hypothetical protein QE400_002304 [Xanthomonas sacchari]|nr:hypothetical protein [Xanthomonas sacchari]
MTMVVPTLDQLPQHRLVADDLGVGGDVGGRRRGAGQLDQVGAVADHLQLALRFEPLAQGHRVERAPLLGQLADRAVDQLVIAPVEVLVGELVVDPVVGLRRQHQAAEYGLFGLDRVRRHPQLVETRLAAFVALAFAIATVAGTGGHRLGLLCGARGAGRGLTAARVPILVAALGRG